MMVIFLMHKNKETFDLLASVVKDTMPINGDCNDFLLEHADGKV
jgi:hypothetical protein